MRDQTRARVVDAAATVIRGEGPHQVHVAKVMAKAGLTHGGFYFHFDSKDALVVAAIEQIFHDGRVLFERITDHADARDALRAYVEYYLSPAHRDETGVSCPLALLAIDAPRLNPPTRRAFADGVDGMRGAVAGLARAAGLSDPDALAASVVAELVGTLILARAEPDRARSDALLAYSRAHVLARFSL